MLFLPRRALRLIQVTGILLSWSQLIHAESQPLYQTIRVTESGDIDRLYPIIAAYAQDPSLAETITEIAIDSSSWRRACDSNCDNGKAVTETEPTTPIRDGAHLALEKHVRRLKLGQDATEAIMRSLEWKKREILGAWDGPFDTKETNNEEFGSVAVAILLSLCPNISTMHLGYLPYKSPIQVYMLKSNYQVIPNPGLQKLATVEIISQGSSGDHRMYTDVEFLAVFQYIHRLPSIQSISMEGVQAHETKHSQFVPRTGNMKKVHIGHADISSPMIHRIITIPKALEDLKLSLGGLWSTDGGLPAVMAFEIGYALREYKDSLKVLDLDIDFALLDGDGPPGWGEEDVEDDDDDWDEDEVSIYGEEYRKSDRTISVKRVSGKQIVSRKEYGSTVGSLREFSALTHLSISIKALMGARDSQDPPFRLKSQPPFRLVEGLPPNLEYLQLYGYVRGANVDVDKHIDELLAKKKKHLPKLKTIEGINKLIPDLGMLYTDEPLEQELWKFPRKSYEWIESEASKNNKLPERDEL